jgi:hypothetical protein
MKKEKISFPRKEQEIIVSTALCFKFIRTPGIRTMDTHLLWNFINNGVTFSDKFREQYPYIIGILNRMGTLDNTGKDLVREVFNYLEDDWERFATSSNSSCRRFFFAFEENVESLAIGALDASEAVRKTSSFRLKEVTNGKSKAM